MINLDDHIKEGSILILRRRNTFGFGIRPVAVVNGYEVREGPSGKAGKYDITMYRDAQGDGFQWMSRNEVLKGVERTRSESKNCYKWTIENKFKKVPVNSVEEALALYKSRQVEHQERTVQISWPLDFYP